MYFSWDPVKSHKSNVGRVWVQDWEDDGGTGNGTAGNWGNEWIQKVDDRSAKKPAEINRVIVVCSASNENQKIIRKNRAK